MTDHAHGASALSHYLRVVRRGAWIVVLTTVVVAGLAILTSRSQEKVYESSAEVFLSGAQNLPASLSDVSQAYTDPVRSVETQARLARVPEVARLALDTPRFRARSPQDLLGRSTVTPNADADILTFSVSDSDPASAAQLATAYARGFTTYRRRLDTQSIVRAQRQIAQRLAELDSQGKSRTGLFRELSRNEQQLRTFEALQGSNAAVIRSGGDTVQTQPKTARNATLGLVLGLVLGIALAFVRDALNTRVRSAEEVHERLGIPLLGRIPQLPKRLVTDNGLAMLDNPGAPETEVFRILATNLGFANLDRGAKTIMVTSAIRGEGKSTTIANTAVALARAGSKVALVDLDLKRPALDRMLGLRGRRVPGITEVALGAVPLNEALVRIPIFGEEDRDAGLRSHSGEGALGVLLTGPIPPNTADFAASGRLGAVLEELAETCDVVLIDAPPILQVSDAMALTAKVDALFVVTRMSAVRRPALNELRRVLDQAPIAKLGFVLTGVRAQEGYGYGYGYGYGSTFDETTATNGSARRLFEEV
jgi:succinoglycan biosynthesis transport protein ExoP